MSENPLLMLADLLDACEPEDDAPVTWGSLRQQVRTAANDAPYRVDPKRERLHEPTGIYVRAKHGERWGIHDIAVLDTDSLFRFFRSRDGDILWVPHDLPPPSAPFMVEIDEDPKAEAAWLRSLGLDPETATRDDLLKVFDGDVIPPGSTTPAPTTGEA